MVNKDPGAEVSFGRRGFEQVAGKGGERAAYKRGKENWEHFNLG